MRPLVLMVVTVVLIIGCARSSTASRHSAAASASATIEPSATVPPNGEVFLPTYPAWDAVPTAEVGGLLVEDNGCLWLENPDGRTLPVWPSGSTVEREGDALVVVNSDGTRAPVGTQVIGGGGEFGGPDHYDFVVETIGEEVPDACRGDDAYTIVYQVHAVDE